MLDPRPFVHDRNDSMEQMPHELSPRRVGRRLTELAVVVAIVGLVVLLGPGLGSVRRDIAHASAIWLVVGVGFEILSALCYVVIFRSVFCPRMGWRLSYQIGMAEQGANSVLSVSGTGGLALGAWALHRGGMSTEHIARRTVAFFFLTSLANVWTLIVLAALFASGVFHYDRNPLTYVFGVASLLATLIVVVGLPRLRRHDAAAESQPATRWRKLRNALRLARNSLGDGVRDGLVMVRRRPISILGGSFGVMGFDLAVLAMCFKAFGHSPPVAVLAVAYLIGQLGGNIPLPGGLVGLDAGLIGVLVLYHQPLAVTTAAVLVYHAISLWVPGLLGSVAFVRLRRTLERESRPAALCVELAGSVETVQPPAVAGAGR